mgnify:CR=1 FL=1
MRTFIAVHTLALVTIRLKKVGRNFCLTGVACFGSKQHKIFTIIPIQTVMFDAIFLTRSGKVIRRLNRDLDEGKLFFGKAINYRKDGSTFMMEWKIAPIRNEKDEITHYLAIQREVS